MPQHQLSPRDTQPWYRQAWPWLLIAIPSSAVIAGIITVILAIRSPNALVVDDYYKDGLAINQKKHRLESARLNGLEGLVRADGSRVRIRLDSVVPVTDQTLVLRLVHSTRPELDRELTLSRNEAGEYSAELPTLRRGAWYLHLQPADQRWEIRNRIYIDGPFQARLSAQG